VVSGEGAPKQRARDLLARRGNNLLSSQSAIRVLVVDDNPLVRQLVVEGLDGLGEIAQASDGADALLKAIDSPPDLIVTDYRMPGLDGRQLCEKLRGREQTRHIPFIFLAGRGDIEEKLRPTVEGVEDFIPKPFFLHDVVCRVKVVADRLRLERMQQKGPRPGVIQGRLEEMGIADLMQSLEMGQKSCRLTLRRNSEVCELFFSAGQCRHAKLGALEGEEAVYPAVHWNDGDFEIDFTAASDRATISRSTTALLMEAMRLLDESNSEVPS
jgi:CheY-like chemotaxis protein